MSRKRRALFISSPIGLGHVQRDLAIARELRKLQPELDIDWFTVDPAARYLEQEGERLHPITQRLANESRHFEHVAGEHDLHAFFALRTMDEIMVRNFMTFSDLMEEEHYDLVIGDEAWDVDYYYHENPELKRQPFVFLTDFVGCLPMEEQRTRSSPVRGPKRRRHRARGALPVCARRGDLRRQPGRRDGEAVRPRPARHPRMDRPQLLLCRLYPALRPERFPDTERLRRKHNYPKDEKIVIASIGGTAVGRPLLRKDRAGVPAHEEAGAGAAHDSRRGSATVAASLFRTWQASKCGPTCTTCSSTSRAATSRWCRAACRTCMELVATRRPFLSFPLQRHFEQNVHVRRRLANYGADRSVSYADLTPEALADARARGDARAGALPAGGDGWCGARCETHRSGPGKPMVGAVLVPHR